MLALLATVRLYSWGHIGLFPLVLLTAYCGGTAETTAWLSYLSFFSGSHSSQMVHKNKSRSVNRESVKQIRPKCTHDCGLGPSGLGGLGPNCCKSMHAGIVIQVIQNENELLLGGSTLTDSS